MIVARRPGIRPQLNPSKYGIILAFNTIAQVVMVRSNRAGGSGRLARRAARGSEYRCAPSVEVRASWAFRAVIERIVIGCSRSSIIIVPPLGADRAVGERIVIVCVRSSIIIVPSHGTYRAVLERIVIGCIRSVRIIVPPCGTDRA